MEQNFRLMEHPQKERLIKHLTSNNDDNSKSTVDMKAIKEFIEISSPLPMASDLLD